eukprot:TRINITY_DN35078_c0_g1_i1.p1 TRINITY_DN35078_c0_g1~~TRINITY_DN35078_c0_g1_i1.p1  ORF type:complete len:307 (-),score=51.86 TRINITY_DN35078_c0_g1_i1:205-1125(-)
MAEGRDEQKTKRQRMSKKVAITGAAGFLGQLSRTECEDLGFDVYGLDLSEPRCQPCPLTPGSAVVDTSKVDCVTENLSKEGAVHGCFDGCDTVIHLAADGRPNADFMAGVLPNNIEATYRIFEEAKRAGVRRVIFASSNHTQFGAIMPEGQTVPDGFSRARLDALGGPASVGINDPLAVAGPDSFYGVSKLFGESLGYLYSRVFRSFDFVALRIGWCRYDTASALRGTVHEDYLRSMWLSKRDFRGFLRAALEADLSKHQGFLVAYAVSQNSLRVFNIKDTVEHLGYTPVDDAEDHFRSTDEEKRN